MDDCSQPFKLIPVRRSSFLRSRDGWMSFTIKAFKMVGKPRSLEELFSVFRSDKRVVIWVGDDCFLRDDKVLRPKDYLFEFSWSLSHLQLRISSKSLEEVRRCLGTLSELSIASGKLSKVGWPFLDLGGKEVCPFSCENLNKFILQNQKGTSGFFCMTFTPSQSRTLATSGKRTHLLFDDCRFQDNGKTFMDAYVSLPKQDSGPAKLQFHKSFAFGGLKLDAFLNKPDELSFYRVLLSAELCRAVLSAELNYLDLGYMAINNADAEQMLINNIREGRGPKGISLYPSVFGSRDTFLQFCRALSYQNEHRYLRTLELADIEFRNRMRRIPDPEAESALIAAWRGNLALTSFGLTGSTISEVFWRFLLQQISRPSSLRKLVLDIRVHGSTATRQERTEQIANVVLANGTIEQMGYCPQTFDQDIWKKRVIPALQHNEHRGRFAAVAAISNGHARNAILAKALNQVSDRPFLLYSLLHRNLDVLMDVSANPRASPALGKLEMKGLLRSVIAKLRARRS